MLKEAKTKEKNMSFESFRVEVLKDYKLAFESRECSLLGRREVLNGKAKFGIFGDGKELPQLAMAKVFRKGDLRSGYYRDQTFMMAIGEYTPRELFSAMYAHTNVELEPTSGGRQMTGHFATRFLNEDGSWKDLVKLKNSSSDISPTGAQMPRLLGLGLASKLYRSVKELQSKENFSKNGNEVAFGTIGNASTSEGLFWETINAMGVMQVPIIMSVWDDEYGISVGNEYHTTKESISEVLKGFQRDGEHKGIEILKVKAWDYTALIKTYEKAEKIAREEHIPVLIHVEDVTQPQGHSTSGSHERYKSKYRLEWEKQHDCILKMRQWILDFNLTDENTGEELRLVNSLAEIDQIEKDAKTFVRESKNRAWELYQKEIKAEQNRVIQILENIECDNKVFVTKLSKDLKRKHNITKKDVLSTARRALKYLTTTNTPQKEELILWIKHYNQEQNEKYSSQLYSEFTTSPLNVKQKDIVYPETPNLVDARIILRDNFDSLLEKHPEIFIFGEDAGFIGDVNQGLEGLQKKYGKDRVFDTSIREATIIGQGIGMAMRGLKPIAEIQYLDYLIYAIQTLSDDLATLLYRTKGGQKAPLIIRTRGHRLEGIWHAGSPMGMIINSLRGIYVLTPRNMTKAAGFYNVLIQGDNPALVVECLNGYRLKENRPENMSEFTTAIGEIEVLKEGMDITMVTYGSLCNIAMEAVEILEQINISVELIDAQSLIPFDIAENIVKSLSKTNKLIVIDEDVEGGASAYILREILEKQNGYYYLDSKPTTLTAKSHRPAYGTDGDYFSKPSVDDIFEKVYEIMNEYKPKKHPALM